MDAPSPDHLRARIQALEAELRALHDENDRLAEAQTDAVLLGFLASLRLPAPLRQQAPDERPAAAR